MSNKVTASPTSATGPQGQLPGRLDTRKFAADGQTITGTVSLANWPRAGESVVDPGAEIGYRIQGGADGSGRPRLQFVLSGTVDVVCQRCLQPMSWPLTGETSVLLAADQRQLDAWDEAVEDAEVVLADQPLDLNELLEDEFLLSLPFAPMCDDPVCPKRPDGAGQGGAEIRMPEDSGPFGALRGKFVSKSN